MSVTIQSLTYGLDSDKTGEHVLISIMNSFSIELNPYLDAENLSSLGVTLPKDPDKAKAIYWPKPIPADLGEAIADKFVDAFTQYWSPDWGYPTVTLLSAGRIPQEYTQYTNVFFFIPSKLQGDRRLWVDGFLQLIPKVSKLHFIGKVGTTDTFATTAHAAAAKWLEQKRYETHVEMMSHQRYNFTKRMIDWYGDQCAALSAAAKGVLDEFTFVKKYSQLIPDYLVVPAYHIARYKKALRLIEEKHTPAFTMTLPLIFNSKEYTILFPVLKEV